MTEYLRKDSYDCGHVYTVGRLGKNVHPLKCPQCDKGNYLGSLVKGNDHFGGVVGVDFGRAGRPVGHLYGIPIIPTTGMPEAIPEGQDWSSPSIGRERHADNDGVYGYTHWPLETCDYCQAVREWNEENEHQAASLITSDDEGVEQ